jgi:hypothetical protein
LVESQSQRVVSDHERQTVGDVERAESTALGLARGHGQRDDSVEPQASRSKILAPMRVLERPDRLHELVEKAGNR